MTSWPPLRRITRIVRVVVGYRLDTLLTLGIRRLETPLGIRAVLALNPLRLLGRPMESDAARLRQAMEALGPVFIKFGQILSTRRDLLPDDYATELAKLQDQVPPFANDQARAEVERELGAPVVEVFAEFEHEPLASASVAQVHAARLHDGRDVVVKVIRPNIEPIIRQDLELLHWLAQVLSNIHPDVRRLRLPEVVADYEHTILGELDLLREADNTRELRRNFSDSPLLYVPAVIDSHTTRSVLTLERLHGVPIADIAHLHRLGVDMKKLAERGVETFFTQVFIHNFFHADMHPGNIFVDVRDPSEPRYMAIDCAIMGSLTDEDQNYLARNLLAFFARDYHEVARLHVESGWVPRNTNVRDFERVIRNVCEPIFKKPLKDISFGLFLLTLFQTARRFQMEVQPQLVLLQKTLLNIEGLGRQLYPDLDLWQTAQPFMARWLRARYGPLANLRALGRALPELVAELPKLPAAYQRLVADMRSQQRATDALLQNAQADRRSRGRQRTVATVLLVGGALWFFGTAGAGGDVRPLADQHSLGAALAAVVGLLLWLRA